MSGGSGSGDGAAIAVEGTATISNEVFNLIKGIIGAGVLSLPAGKSVSLLLLFCYLEHVDLQAAKYLSPTIIILLLSMLFFSNIDCI